MRSGAKIGRVPTDETHLFDTKFIEWCALTAPFSIILHDPLWVRAAFLGGADEVGASGLLTENHTSGVGWILQNLGNCSLGRVLKFLLV